MNIESAISNLIIFPARCEAEQHGVAYGDVEFAGKRYSVQYSRPRPGDADIYLYTDDGHEPNSDLYTAMSAAVGYDLGMDWQPAVEMMVLASGAARAIEESEVA